MRTTITLDPDTRLLIERAMRERGLSFKDAVNEAIRVGLAPRATRPRGRADRGSSISSWAGGRAGGARPGPRTLGPARVDLTKALTLAGDLEDESLIRRLTEGR